MAALRPCVPHQRCSARFESPELFPRAFQIWSISLFSRHPNIRFCAKRVSSQKVKIASGPETYCFRTVTFSEVFLLGVGGVFSIKNVSSERFSLARFWAKRVFSEKGLLVLFPPPGKVLPEPLLKPLFGHMLKPLCHTLSCNGFQCVAAWGYHPEHAQNILCSIQ